MKNSYLLFITLLIGGLTAKAQYCTPTYSSGCSLDAIQYFSLKGESGTVIYNNSGACVSAYTNYTASFSPVNLAFGNSYSGFLRTQDVNNYVSIWIDQNNNNTFESTERILNNLKIGPTNLLYSIFIPPAFALGLHRMRVRSVYYSSAPATATDPCSLYTYGETEDYQVNITNTPGTRSVSAGLSGSCVSSSVTTIDASSNNISGGPVHLLDSSNNIYTAVYPNSNNLGRVSANIYVHSGSVRLAPNGSYYMNRNINLSSANAPATTVNLRLFYKNTELNALIAQPSSGVTSQFDLTSTKNTDACLSALADVFGTQLFPTGYGSLSGDRFLDFIGLSSLGSFYFSGPSLASTCQPPLSPGVVLSSSTAGTFNWSAPAGGGVSGYQWAITSSSTPPASGSSTASTSVSFSSLTAGQVYYAHVRSVCGVAFSSWTTMSFVSIFNDIPCNATTLIPTSLGGVALCENNTNATSVNDPSLSCSAPNNTMWYKFTPAVTGNVNLHITTPATGDPLHGWVGVYTATGACPSLTLTQILGGTCYEFGQSGNNDVDDIVLPALTAGVTYYFMIDGFASDFGSYCIDLSYAVGVPTCTTNLLPANGATNVAIPGSTITLSWNPEISATMYDVYLGTTDPPAIYGNTTATSISIAGLSYNQTYYWYIGPRNAIYNAYGCESTRFSFTTANPTNCIPLYTTGCNDGDSLTYFSLKGESGSVIYSASGNACAPAPNLGYSNYTASFSPVIMSAGESYTGFLRTGYPNNYVSMWIDFNDNGYFEDNERLLNNLNVGTTKLLYSMAIPITATLGTHRLRVRNVFYYSVPSTPTHPCNPYTYGETEDYMVAINNTPGARSVAPGVAGTCQLSSVTTIDAASNNLTINGIRLLDSLNRYVCSIYPDGNAFGRTSANYYVHSGAVRLNAAGNYYLNRNLHLNVDAQPATNYRMRLYYRNTELNALIAQAGSGVTSQFDLGLLQNPDACTNAMSSLPATRKLPSGYGSISGDRLIDFVNLNAANGFYLLRACLPSSSTSQVNACGVSNPSYVWNGNTYTASGTYSMTFTNASGCDSVATLQLVLGTYPIAGTANASPTAICLGSPVTLSYSSCGMQAGFSGAYSPANWALGYSGSSNGTITPFAPDSVVMVSSNGLSGNGATSWSIPVSCSGVVQFDWDYSTVDGAVYDYPRYAINSSLPQLLPGYNQFGASAQSGTSTISVNAGDTLTLDIYSVDNSFGSCTARISNFQAPIGGGPVDIKWYTDAGLLNLIGTGNMLSYTPPLTGTYTFYAKVNNPGSVCTVTVPTNPVTVINGSCNASLVLTLALQGYYNTGGTMAPVLYNQGVSASTTNTDQILVQLVDPITLAVVASSTTVLTTNGIANCTFGVASGSYYIVVKHRNTIETWSALPVAITSGGTSYYNFSVSASQAYGSNQVEVETGIWALYSGDVNQDENVDLLDLGQLESDINGFLFGYFGTDLNGDGNVDLLDIPTVESNINAFIFSIHP